MVSALVNSLNRIGRDYGELATHPNFVVNHTSSTANFTLVVLLFVALAAHDATLQRLSSFIAILPRSDTSGRSTDATLTSGESDATICD